MKKSLFTLIVLSLCSLLAAQFIVWRNGQIVYQSDINEVDSITLYEYKLPDTPNEPDVESSFSLKYEGKEIKDGDIIDVTMDNYEWGDLVARIYLTNKANRAKNFTLEEVRNYDYTEYIPALCVNMCMPGNGKREQLWEIGEISVKEEKEIAMHLRVEGQPSADCVTNVTISNENESLSFVVKFKYETQEEEPLNLEDVYLYGNCTQVGIHGHLMGIADNQTHTYSAASLLDGSKLYEKGTHLLGIRAYIGDEVTDASVWVGEDYKNPEHLKEFTYKKGGWQYVMFDEPVILTNEDIYIGYTITGIGSILAAEGVTKNHDSEWICLDGEWMLLREAAGNALWSIQAIVAGGDYSSENQYDIAIENIFAPKNVSGGELVNVTCEVRNAGVKKTGLIEFTCTLGGVSVSTTLSEQMMNGQSTIVALPSIEVPKISGISDLIITAYEIGVIDAVVEDNEVRKSLRVYTETVPRNCLLIEQFIGQDCPNCPGGSKQMASSIDGMKDPSKAVWVAHHAGYFDDSFTLPESKTIASSLGVNATPMCNINRAPRDYGMGTEELIWHPGYATTKILEIALNEPGLATIEMNRTYNAETRELTVEVKGRALESTAYITAIVTQSGIEARQAGGSASYVHNNAPRAFLTEAKGDKLELDEDGNYTVTYTYTIPEKVGDFECIPENMKFVAFIHGDVNGEDARLVYNADQVSLLSDSSYSESNCNMYQSYYTDLGDGTALYVFEFMSKGLDAETTSGSGEDVIIMFCATPQEDGCPAPGTYEFVEFAEWTENQGEGLLEGVALSQEQIAGTFVYIVEDGKIIDIALCAGGKVKFDGNATKGILTANITLKSAVQGNEDVTYEREYIYNGSFDMYENKSSAPTKAIVRSVNLNNKLNYNNLIIPFAFEKLNNK